jgi:hypothetical protein
MMQRLFIYLGVGVLVLVAAALPRAAQAYVCETYDGENCIRWLDAQATIRSFLGAPSQPLINGTLTWDQNTFLAGGDWTNANAGFRFNVFTGGTFLDPCTTPGPCEGTGAPGENPVIFTNTVCGRGFGGDVIAQTINCYRLDNGGIVNAPVFFNSNVGWNAYDGSLIPGVTDIRRVIAHELGHVAGLGHPDDSGQNVVALMNRRVSSIDRPQADDLDGMRFVYGGGPPPPPGGGATSGGCHIAPAAGAQVSWTMLLLLLAPLLTRLPSECCRALQTACTSRSRRVSR